MTQYGGAGGSGGCSGGDCRGGGGGCSGSGCGGGGAGLGSLVGVWGGVASGIYTCNIVVEEVSSTVEKTEFETLCATVTDQHCKTELKTFYGTRGVSQCSPNFSTKCKPLYKTAYKKYCTTVQDTECKTSVETIHKTEYEQKCSTVNTKKCLDIGYGKISCSFVPEQKCHQVEVHLPETNPSRLCSQVPKERCHQVPQQIPIKMCVYVPQKDCSTIPLQVPVAIPVQKCRAVPRKHCQSLPVTRPRVVNRNIPRNVCTIQADAFRGGEVGPTGGQGGEFGGPGISGDSPVDGYGNRSRGNIRGFDDNRKDSIEGDTNKLQRKQTVLENTLESKPFDATIVVKTSDTAKLNNIEVLNMMQFMADQVD